MKRTIIKYILILLFTVPYSATFAQNTPIITYFNNKNKEVKNIEDAEYTRTTTLLDNNLYSLLEEYINGNIKREGTLTVLEPNFKFINQLVSYYKNGNKQSVYNYNQKNKLDGEAYLFYLNGSLKEKRIYQETDLEILNDFLNENYKVMQIADSLGNTFLDDNGTGKFSITQKNGNSELGEYVNGMKTGFWKSEYPKAHISYEDEYLEGKFIKGRTINADGTTLDYDILEALPTFNGGLEMFGKFLGENLQYPPRARRNNKEGRVYMSFVVEKTGKLVDIKVTKGVSSDINAEAIRVMKLSPNWIPGMQRGKKVRVSYTIPIFFKLD